MIAPHDPSKAVATFTNLPRHHTLTTRVDIPEPWNVQAKEALQDIDNLRCVSGKPCGDIHSGSDTTNVRELTKVSYVLKNLLVSGQCFETADASNGLRRRGSPPNGLQLTLDPANDISQIGEEECDFSGMTRNNCVFQGLLLFVF